MIYITLGILIGVPVGVFINCLFSANNLHPQQSGATSEDPGGDRWQSEDPVGVNPWATRPRGWRHIDDL